MMGIGAMGGFGALGGLGMLFGPLLWVGLIALVIWAAVNLVPRDGGPVRERQHVTALDLLNVRYARGEIAAAEYEQKKRDLSLG